MPTQISLTNVLIDEIDTNLERYLSFVDDPDVPNASDNEAIAGLVRAGKLQDDPTIYGVNILIHPAIEDDPEEIYSDNNKAGWDSGYTYEIGGTVPTFMWIKKFRVELKLFFDREFERSVAQQKAQVVLGRARHGIHKLNNRMGDMDRDSFGEAAHIVAVTEAYLREGGGSGTFIWRGRICIHVLCDYDADAVDDPYLFNPSS